MSTNLKRFVGRMVWYSYRGKLKIETERKWNQTAACLEDQDKEKAKVLWRWPQVWSGLTQWGNPGVCKFEFQLAYFWLWQTFNVTYLEIYGQPKSTCHLWKSTCLYSLLPVKTLSTNLTYIRYDWLQSANLNSSSKPLLILLLQWTKESELSSHL